MHHLRVPGIDNSINILRIFRTIFSPGYSIIFSEVMLNWESTSRNFTESPWLSLTPPGDQKNKNFQGRPNRQSPATSFQRVFEASKDFGKTYGKQSDQSSRICLLVYYQAKICYTSPRDSRRFPDCRSITWMRTHVVPHFLGENSDPNE